MKAIIIFFSIFFLWACTSSSKENHNNKDTLSAQKLDKFNDYVNNRLTEIKSDSVLLANLKNNESVYVLSILPSREKSFWIVVSPNKQEITSNFKNVNLAIQRKDYKKIISLIDNQKKVKNIDGSFCFECYADPTVFVLEDIKSGRSKRTINLVKDWRFICSKSKQ